MRINKRLRKAFTLVELVVVIAIIAILSTVSVVTYFGITNSAKKSVDDTLIAELNKCLQLDETINGKPNTPSEALEVVEENGFTVEKMTPTQDKKEIVWHQTTNKFELVDEITENTTDVTTWRFLSDYTDNHGYSVYLKEGNEATSLDIITGLDVGKNDIETVNYVRKNVENGQTVLIRTTTGLLTIDAEKDTINHYGSANEVNVKNCDFNSYHVFGKVAGTINVEKGHVAIENTGSVGNINIKAESSSDFVISNDKGGSLSFVKADNPDLITSENVKVTKDTGVMNAENKDAVAYSESNGFLKEWNTVLGNGKTTLLADLEDKVYFVQVYSNIEATFDLNGHHFWTDESGESYVCGKLIFMDSSKDESGLYYCKVNYISDNQDKTILKAIGKDALLVIDSGKIEARNANNSFDSNNGQFGLGVQDGGNIIMNGGTIKAGWYAIAGNGANTEFNSSIVINGGKLISVCDYAIYLPHSGTTTINGGTIDGAAGAISINRGSLTINNGTFLSNGTGDTGDWGDGTGANENNALINSEAKYGDVTIFVNGGDFNVIKLDVFAVGSKYKSYISIKSGTYNKYIDKWVSVDCICVDNGNGTWSIVKK